jgi:hypothetical protein
VPSAIWWIVFEGMFIDLLGIGLAPFEIVSHSIAAFGIVFAANKLFTNRSYYGLCATFFIGAVLLTGMEILMGVFGVILDNPTTNVKDIVLFWAYATPISFLLFMMCFPFSKSIKKIIDLLNPIE